MGACKYRRISFKLAAMYFPGDMRTCIPKAKTIGSSISVFIYLCDCFYDVAVDNNFMYTYNLL